MMFKLKSSVWEPVKYFSAPQWQEIDNLDDFYRL